MMVLTVLDPEGHVLGTGTGETREGIKAKMQREGVAKYAVLSHARGHTLFELTAFAGFNRGQELEPHLETVMHTATTYPSLIQAMAGAVERERDGKV